MKRILFILVLCATFAPAQTSVAPPAAEKPAAKLLILWQPKNCRTCQSKMIGGQEFQIISDENVVLAFHGGAGADFLVGDVYILNKSRRALDFDPDKQVAVSAWSSAGKTATAAAYENLRPLPADEALRKTPRPEFWTEVLRALGDRRAAVKALGAPPVLLKAARLAPGESAHGTIYLPKGDAHESIGFNVAVGDRVYSFAFRSRKNNPSAAK